MTILTTLAARILELAPWTRAYASHRRVWVREGKRTARKTRREAEEMIARLEARNGR